MIKKYVKFFKEELKNGAAPIHVVVACVLLVIDKKITEEQSTDILSQVFEGDKDTLIKLLKVVPVIVPEKKAYEIINRSKEKTRQQIEGMVGGKNETNPGHNNETK